MNYKLNVRDLIKCLTAPLSGMLEWLNCILRGARSVHSGLGTRLWLYVDS